jgi:hypothetical protein
MDWELRLWGISLSKLNAEAGKMNQFIELFQESTPYCFNEALPDAKFSNLNSKVQVQPQIDIDYPPPRKFSILF